MLQNVQGSAYCRRTQYLWRLGSAVAEVLSKACPTPMEFVGATDFANQEIMMNCLKNTAITKGNSREGKIVINKK